MKFSDLSWHDAIVKTIDIDRSNPGIRDVIKLVVEWPDNDQTSVIVFSDVYWIVMNLNCGIVANESVLSAFELDADNDYENQLRADWRGLIDDIELKTYSIDFNSTGSSLVILARTFDIELSA